MSIDNDVRLLTEDQLNDLRPLSEDELQVVSGGWNAESMIRLCIEQNEPPASGKICYPNCGYW
jgi:hypothetical protein